MSAWAYGILTLEILLLTSIPPILTLPVAWLHQADHLVEQREYTRALERYANAMRFVESSGLHSRVGNVYLRRNQVDEATAHFMRALALDAGSPEALLGLALIALERGRYGEAAGLLERAREIRPSDPEIAYRLGIAYLWDFEFERAAAVFGSVGDQTSAGTTWAPKAAYGLGLAYLAWDLDLARSQFAKVSGDPDIDRMARLMQGVSEELGEMPEEEAYARARLGHTLLQVGQKRLARWYLENAVARRPDYVEARAYLGYAYWQEGREQEALEALQEAVRLGPSLPIVHYFMGIVLRGQHRLSEAAAEFGEMIRLDGASAEAYVELAHTLTVQSRYAEAERAFDEAMRLRPEDVEMKLVAIWFHLDHLFDVQRGLQIARETARIAPSDPDVEDAVGWALYVNGHVDEAEKVLRQAVAVAPFSARARYHLAVLLRSRGDFAGAEAEYRRAIDLDTEGGFARRAADAIKSMQGG